MKKLTLLLLLAFSTPAFAQKNELVLSPGVTYYSLYYSKAKSPHILNNSGYTLSLSYLRSIKWLQIGCGLELGKLNDVKLLKESPGTLSYINAVADPYWAANIQANYRLVKNQWSFYAGLSGGYLSRNTQARLLLREKDHSLKVVGRTEKEFMSGWYYGGQAGAVYTLRPNLGVSAGLAARFARFETVEGWLQSPYDVSNDADRLNMYTISLGAHYKF